MVRIKQACNKYRLAPSSYTVVRTTHLAGIWDLESLLRSGKCTPEMTVSKCHHFDTGCWCTDSELQATHCTVKP